MNQDQNKKAPIRLGRIVGITAVIAVFAIILAACSGMLTPAAPAADAGSDQVESTVETAADETAADETATEAGANDSLVLSGDEESYNGIPVGFTEEGYPYRGSLDAPVTIYEYSDYECPFCSRYFIQTEPAINDQYVRDGVVRVIFRDFPLEQLHPNAYGAHEATLCVAQQGAAAYWEMHAEIFKTQSAWSQLSEPVAFFAELASDIGIDVDAFNACMDSDETVPLIDAGVADAREAGFSGTPSFQLVSEASGDAYSLVGAQPYEQFATYIDAIAAGEAPAAPAAAEAGDPEIPFWATAEGLAPDPDNPGYTMAGDAYRGNTDAEVVVVEFSDFQCPYCRRHTEETQPILDEQFVDTDQVMWVFKHFPLDIHPQAPMAGAAAECAGAQGLFWEMEELLFANTQSWSVSDPTEALTEIAGQLDLDMDAFEACLADEASLALVESDRAEGAAFVRGTPTFIVLKDGAGSIIPGALPAESFSEALQQLLDGETTN